MVWVAVKASAECAEGCIWVVGSGLGGRRRRNKDALSDTSACLQLFSWYRYVLFRARLGTPLARRWRALQLLVLAAGAARILISNIFEDLGFSFHSHRAVAKAVGNC